MLVKIFFENPIKEKSPKREICYFYLFVNCHGVKKTLRGSVFSRDDRHSALSTDKVDRDKRKISQKGDLFFYLFEN